MKALWQPLASLRSRVVMTQLVKAVLCFVMVNGASIALAQYGFPATADPRSRDLSTMGGFGWNLPGTSAGFEDPRAMQPMATTPNWTLGIAPRNTDRGVLIERIQPGSPAAQARLEVGDVIINVGGYQVGNVEQRVYDVGDEIRRRATPQGTASLLVYSRRTRDLEPVVVNLQSSSIVVRGVVFRRDRQALPQGAVLQVRIDNVTRPYAGATGDAQSFAITSQSQIPFELNLDRQFIYPTDRYQIQASIAYGNQILYTSAQAVPIDLTSNPAPLQLEVVNAIGQASGSQSYSVGYSPNNANEIRNYYVNYLRREPQSTEMQAWMDHFNRGRSKAELPISLLGSQDFYDSVGQNNTAFINQIFRVVVGKPPSQIELNQWLQALQNSGNNRNAIVRQLYNAIAGR